MKRVKSILGEIKRGENIEFYVTVFVAIVLTVLTFFDLVKLERTTPIILAVLALLAISMLGNRQRIDSILKRFPEYLQKGFDETYIHRKNLPKERELDQEIEKVKSVVYIKGSSFGGLRGQGFHEKFKSFLDNNKKLQIRILVFDPKSSVIGEVAKRAGITESTIKEDINSWVQKLDELKKKYRNRIDYRFYTSIPTCGVVLFDPDSTYGSLRLEPYVYEAQPPVDRPILYFSKRNEEEYYGKIYAAILKEWGNE